MKIRATLLLIAFSARSGAFSTGGGRTPMQPNMPSLDGLADLVPPKPCEVRLTVIQVTDVYTLANLPSLKTLLAETKAANFPGSVISVLTGDFLAPYLLSSVDKGAGMMSALAKCPIDYLTWGNHEADIDHRTVCSHVRAFPGTWLNTNMQSHAAMDAQKAYDVVELTSQDGSQTRRIGLVAVLSDDPALYLHFKPPGAFGGAKIECPWQTLSSYKSKLEGPEERCDVVLPLQHMYVPDDHRTCREFDFPVVLSGHDHHRVDEVIAGTRLLKPGLDAIAATVLQLSWPSAASPSRPQVRASFVEVANWRPDEALLRETSRAYSALLPLRNTELSRVPPTFEPLSSSNSRGTVCTMGKYICSLLKSSLNTVRRQRAHAVDAVLLMGGNIRGGSLYPLGSYFSLEMLEAEVKSDESLGVVEMPGWLLDEAVTQTHAGDPIPGWFQYDSGVREEGGRVVDVGGLPLEPLRVYRVGTKVSDLTNGQSAALTAYYTLHPNLLPPKGAYVNVHSELMGFFARNMWRKIWEAIAPRSVDGSVDTLCQLGDEPCQSKRRLEALDLSASGDISVQDIHTALQVVVGLSVDADQQSLATFIHSFADADGDGKVTLADFETFCAEMPALYANQEWRLAYPKSQPPSKTDVEGDRGRTAI